MKWTATNYKTASGLARNFEKRVTRECNRIPYTIISNHKSSERASTNLLFQTAVFWVTRKTSCYVDARFSIKKYNLLLKQCLLIFDLLEIINKKTSEETCSVLNEYQSNFLKLKTRIKWFSLKNVINIQLQKIMKPTCCFRKWISDEMLACNSACKNTRDD